MIEKEVTFIIQKDKVKKLYDLLSYESTLYDKKYIEQYYSESENFRLRSQVTSKSKEYFFNKKIKSFTNPGASYEFEESISEEAFYDMLRHCDTHLLKTRFSREMEPGLHYDIDFYYIGSEVFFYYHTIEVEYTANVPPTFVDESLREYVRAYVHKNAPSNHSIAKMNVAQKLSIYENL